VKVTFRNLGPIEEATLDLSKRLTVLVGKNNTGKTFLASAAYAVHHERTSKAARREVLRPLVNVALASGTGDVSLAALETASGAFISAWSADVANSIPRCLGLSNREIPQVEIQWDLRLPASGMHVLNLDGHELAITCGNGAEGLRLRTVNRGARAAQLASLGGGVDIPRVPLPREAEDRVLDAVASLIDSSGDWNSQPAERLGIRVFAHELSATRFLAVDEMLESDGTFKQLSKARPYPWVVRDALIWGISRRSSSESTLTEALEGLLGGRVVLNDQRDFEFQLPDGATLSTNEVSSSIKSLAGLVLQYRSGSRWNRLVLDEPEMSLHPDLQRKFARWLGRAVGEGQRFLIATHSDYIVRELSHLLMMHNASPGMRKVMEENGYSPEEAIDPEHIEVLRLGEGRATKVEVGRYGFRVDTIDEELQRISALSQDLFAELDEPVVDTSGE